MPRTALITYAVAEASTAHISNDDRLLLDSACEQDRGLGLRIREDEWGWQIFCRLLHQEPEHTARLRAFGFSEAFLGLLIDASKQGARWLDLDADATEYDHRPSFTW